LRKKRPGGKYLERRGVRSNQGRMMRMKVITYGKRHGFQIATVKNQAGNSTYGK
jgi:hypothetical protein